MNESAKHGPVTLYRKAEAERLALVHDLTAAKRNEHRLAIELVASENERDRCRIALIEIGRGIIPDPIDHARKALGVKDFRVSEAIPEVDKLVDKYSGSAPGLGKEAA